MNSNEEIVNADFCENNYIQIGFTSSGIFIILILITIIVIIYCPKNSEKKIRKSTN